MHAVRDLPHLVAHDVVPKVVPAALAEWTISSKALVEARGRRPSLEPTAHNVDYDLGREVESDELFQYAGDTIGGDSVYGTEGPAGSCQ